MSNNNKKQYNNLKFIPFTTAVESAFWVRYCREKLETIQLDESPLNITLQYGIQPGQTPVILQCRESALDVSSSEDSKTTNSETLLYNNNNNNVILVEGSLIGYNTRETFLKTDKNALLRHTFCQRFFASNDQTAVLKSLNSALLITFCDLKQHKVLYWFGVPVLVPQQSIRCEASPHVCNPTELLSLHQAVDAFRRQSLSNYDNDDKNENNNGLFPYFLYAPSHDACAILKNKSHYESFVQQHPDAVVAFFDPSPQPMGSTEQLDSTTAADNTGNGTTMVGWPLRNLIAYLCFHLKQGGKTIPILRYQPTIVRRVVATESETGTTNESSTMDVSGDAATILYIEIPNEGDYQFGDNDYRVVGWELNARSKPGPRSVNLRPLIDPDHLAIQAADLNLRLMKWRMIPKLKVDELQQTKVLLIGAGTLGCNVARVLLGWGVRHFKIVDYGKVSYSNPVRQSLFTLEDCRANGGGGRPKAEAAAKALKTIAADVESEGMMLSIPMPGHPDNGDSIRESVETLDALVQESDVVFLLTDTRESRWLPTVMANCYGKMLINAALGLDSWLVMRHGVEGNIKHGCYFCNDVVAPENSMKNRTMDQQCTVTRPGLALIASSMAVEMMVALMHHPKGPAAPAPVATTSNFSPTVNPSDPAACPLGIIPHQVRGSLVTYTMMTPTVPAFQYCTACSKGVVDRYKQNKVSTVQNVCQNASSYLEELSGLTAFRAEEAERMVEIGDWDDDDM